LTRREYPWGNEPPEPTRANFGKCCFILKGEILNAVGSYEAGKTPEGVYDMAGNVGEWVYDWYGRDYYRESEYKNPRGPETGKYHVIRGGAWNSLPPYMRSADRYGFDDGKDFYGIGCRCAKSAEGGG
jgi:formylglycine-generating enzyme required for sulfatase activity